MKHNKQAWTIAVLFLLTAGAFAQINNGGGGSGSGTVGNCAAAGNAYYSASGTTTSCDTSLTDNGAGALTSAQGTITTSAPVLSHTATWNASGVAFTNWLSNITCTAAATGSIAAGLGVGGTTWQFKFNAANCGNPQLISPAGAVGAPALAIGSATDGLWQSGSHNLVAVSNGFNAGNFNGQDGLDLNPASTIGWCNTVGVGTCTSGATTISLLGNTVSSNGVLGVGTAGGGDTGLLRTGDACRITSDVTLTVNTATTVCSWLLPAVAKAWAWQCQIPWVVSAGTGTNTLAIIANPSQTPTAATNGSAEIKTTNANVATEATTAISASGGTTLLTSPTLTPSATVFMSSTSGTVLASATAGTFAIQMTAAGTTATAAAKAGATCILY